VFSPRLDELGNPLRGVRACEELSALLQLHLLDYRGRARPAIRRLYHGTEMRSKRLRNAAATSCLDKLGAAICVFEFQGNLFFGNTELAVRRILRAANLRYAILDLGRVTSIDSVAANLLRGVCETLVRSGKEVLVAAVPEEFRSRLHLDRSAFAATVDRALEHCEDALLCGALPAQSEDVADVPLTAFPLLAMLTPDEVGILGQVLEPRTYETGQSLIEEGEASQTLYFIASGTVDVCVGRGATRLASVDAGNAVGELALLGHGARTAAVIAATQVRALALDTAQFLAVSRDYPEIRVKLLAAVGQSLSERLRRANAIIQSLTV
jgi:glutaminase